MIRLWLTYLLLILVALQSMTAVADAHRFHQSGTQHLEFNQNHVHQTNASLEASVKSLTKGQDKNAIDQRDCHHCCHCHSTANSALVKAPAFYLTYSKAFSPTTYSNQSTNAPTTGFYRPPKV